MRPAFCEPAPRFFKASASGNDFLLADARALPGWDPGPDAVRALCRRNDGAGADGLIVLGPSRRGDAAFFLRNRDGSSAAFSGNGARCAALLLHELGVRREEGRVDLELAAGRCEARVLPREESAPARVEVSLGAPRDVRLDIELPPGSPRDHGDHAIVGVPYLALQVASRSALAELDIQAAAPPLRRWSALPEGANVAFHARSADGMPTALRTWERGVEGETRSSGTGCAMVALAVALRAPAQPRRRLEFLPPSGSVLAVTILREGDVVVDLLLEGEARLVAELTPFSDSLLT